MQKLILTLIFCFIFGSFVIAQNIDVKGTVRSSKDSSVLQGVSILIKGVPHGTISNTTGEYSISCPANAVLVFTSMGYTSREIPVNGGTQIDVLLTPATENQLGDVVVTTALGIKKEQKSLGYAVQEVKGETMAKSKEPTPMGALVGKVAGLDIQNTTDLFENPSISLRGVTPLIVIDGIPDPSADPYKINADDIESITVLKGTAAGALYGSIGINGAILYTTKKGHRGSLQVEANSSNLFETGFTRIPQVQTEYGDGNFGQYAYVDGSGGGTEGGGWIWGPKLNQKDASTPSGYWETTQYNSPVNADGSLQPLPWIARGKNNLKNFFQTGVLTSNSISATIGSDKGSFRISAADVYQKGIDPNTSLNNVTFSVGGNYALTDKLTVDTKLTFNRQFSNNYPSTGYGQANVLYNLVLWMGADVDVRDLKNYWMLGKEGLQQRNYNLSWYNNPWFVMYQNLNGYRKDNTYGEATLTYQFNKDWSLKFRNGFNEYAVDQDNKEPYSFIGGNNSAETGDYWIKNENYFDINTDLILTYNHTFNKNWILNVTAGAANHYTNYKSAYTITDGLTIPGFYNLANSAGPLTATNTLNETRIASVYAMADLQAMKFLYFSFTGRRDQTSTLPLAHNAYFYPSAGVSAVLSDAFKLPELISFWKLRASWAQVNSGTIGSGNNPYVFLTTYGTANKWNGTPALSWPSTIYSPSLIPNTTLSGEYGTTIGLLKNRINIDATYFRNLLKNQFAPIIPSQASGYTGIEVNANEYLRKGWEFVVSGTPVKNRDFSWNTTVNFSNNHEWLHKSTLRSDHYLASGGVFYKEGQRMDAVWIDNSQTPDGKAIYYSNGFESYDPVYHVLGYSDPKWLYGWQNAFAYKNFSLSFQFDGRIGGLIYSSTNQKMWWGGTAKGTVTKYRDDANAGNATYVGPGVVVASGDVSYDQYGNITSDTRTYSPNTTAVNYISFMQSTSGDMLNNYFYYSGTYLKLRNVVLTYNLPKKLIKGIFKEASVSVLANNLFILAKIPNVDPDAESDNLQTPSIRSMGFNLDIKF